MTNQPQPKAGEAMSETKQHVWGPRVNGGPGVRCEDCLQSAKEPHQNTPCDGEPGTGEAMRREAAAPLADEIVAGLPQSKDRLEARIAELEGKLAEANKKAASAVDDARAMFQAHRAWHALMKRLEALRELDILDPDPSPDDKLNAYVEAWTKMRDRATTAAQSLADSRQECERLRKLLTELRECGDPNWPYWNKKIDAALAREKTR